MMSKINWQKSHKFQEKPGWCGPAVIQMIFSVVGIKKTQIDIARAVYKNWWGTSKQLMFAYLSRFFKLVNFKQNAKISDINIHLKKGHIVVVNWWDDLDEKGEENGHYSIVGNYDPEKKEITLVDPSKSRKGIWKINSKDFDSKWYDTLDVHNKIWIEGWMLWVDQSSKL